MESYILISDLGETVTNITNIHFHYSGPHPFKKKVTDKHIVIEVLIAEANGITKEFYNIQRETINEIESYLKRRILNKHNILKAFIIDLYVLKHTPRETQKLESRQKY